MMFLVSVIHCTQNLTMFNHRLPNIEAGSIPLLSASLSAMTPSGKLATMGPVWCGYGYGGEGLTIIALPDGTAALFR